VIFGLINLIVETFSLEPLINSLLIIETLFSTGLKKCAQKEKFTSNMIVKLLSFFRKILPIIEGFSETLNKKDLINTVFEISKSQI